VTAAASLARKLPSSSMVLIATSLPLLGLHAAGGLTAPAREGVNGGGQQQDPTGDDELGRRLHPEQIHPLEIEKITSPPSRTLRALALETIEAAEAESTGSSTSTLAPLVRAASAWFCCAAGSWLALE
jgi:hypothetical protein